MYGGAPGLRLRKGLSLLRAPALVLIIVSTVVACSAWQTGEEPPPTVELPELRDAPEPFAARSEASAGEASRSGKSAEVRIGSFEQPEEVPEYEILEESRARREGARGAWLLVDTRSRSEEEYTLIARDIKARYADLDAVSVEFIDLSSALRYNGGALIFNTPAGADYIGYVYGPPNNQGYYVRAAQ